MAASNLSGQIADFAQAVTTSDTASNQYTYLYIGGAGNVYFCINIGPCDS